MPDPLVLYSTNTSIARLLSVEYYGDVHWVWAGDVLDDPGGKLQLPPSSLAGDLFRRYMHDVNGKDTHSSLIERNRARLLDGCKVKQKEGILDDGTARRIRNQVRYYPIPLFKPLLYIIPYTPIAHLVKRVPPELTASTASNEYIIEELPGGKFDVFELV